jgi:ABC-type multidrug transport system fused ATPase/permease subunit
MLRNINIFLNQKEKLLIVILLFFLIITACLEIIGIGALPVLIASFFDNKFSEIKYVNFFLNQFKFFEIFFEKKISIILIICFFIFLFFLLKNLILLSIYYFEEKLFEKILNRNSLKLYDYYLKKDYLYHLSSNPNILSKNIILEIQGIKNVILIWTHIIRELIILSGIFLIIFITSPIVSIFLIFLIFLINFFFYFFVKKNLERKGNQSFVIRNEQLKSISEVFNSIKDIKIYSKENILLNSYKKKNELFQQNNSYLNVVVKIPKLLIETFVVFFITGLCSFFFITNKPFEYIIFYLGIISILSIRIIPGYSFLTMSISKLKFLSSSYKTITNELLSSNNFSKYNIKKKDIFFKDSIEFRNVYFTYPNRNIKSLIDINFKIEKNSIFGITGESGSGKTTLINLLLGLFNPTSGDIFMNKTNSINVNKKSWFRNFSFVSQDLYLLDDSIQNNITFGKVSGSRANQKIQKIIKKLNLENFVNSLHNKLDTNIGNRGLKISGGQRQRIGIARALYFESKILVLDESTNSLDKNNEDFIIKFLQKLKNKMTIIIIYHNSSISKICDKIIRLQNGKIIS